MCCSLVVTIDRSYACSLVRWLLVIYCMVPLSVVSSLHPVLSIGSACPSLRRYVSYFLRLLCASSIISSRQSVVHSPFDHTFILLFACLRVHPYLPTCLPVRHSLVSIDHSCSSLPPPSFISPCPPSPRVRRSLIPTRRSIDRAGCCFYL